MSRWYRIRLEQGKPHRCAKESKSLNTKENTMKRVIEIRAAEGGEDSKLFVKDLAQAYIRLAARHG